MDFLHRFPQIPPPRLSFLHSLPGTVPLDPVSAALPPLIYYVALLLQPPIPSNPIPNLTATIRNILALSAGILFLRLPLKYHVPFSVGLTYQLALVGIYGAARVVDIFFISRYWLNHIPRRVTYTQIPRTPASKEVESGDDSYFSLHFLMPKEGDPVTEHARSEEGLPTKWSDRMSWALELELAMRGAGFTWSSADVRHTRRTWRPTISDRVHSILLHVLPVVLGSWAVIRTVQVRYLVATVDKSKGEGNFDELPYKMQVTLTAALGAFLIAAFSLGHSSFAIILNTFNPHPLGYFPPLYSKRIWEITSVRCFWSYGWHRLFSRFFLVYGTWPGEWLERKLLGKDSEAAADVGKVLGAFLSSAFVHSFAGHTVVPGGWKNASGEAWFFFDNGIAVIVEEVIKRMVLRRRRLAMKEHTEVSGTAKGDAAFKRWYDDIVGRIWWCTVLLYTGRNFARGWVLAGLVKEMSFT